MGTHENPELLTTVEEQARNNEGQMLKGALGSLANELKLLCESMDEKYAKLDEKYIKLETTISPQKSDVTTEISKLEQSIAVQKVEISSKIMSKIENNTEKLEEII